MVSYAPERTVAAVPMMPTLWFLVARTAASTPGTTTPKMGVSVAARMASRLLELAVLHATMMAFTSFVSRKRTFCKENLVTASLDLLP